MKDYIIKITDGVACNPRLQFAKPVNAAIGRNEYIAVVGPNGAGKSVLVDMLRGKHALKEGRLEYDFSPSGSQAVHDKIKYIAFLDACGANDEGYFYQQRWNSTEQGDCPTVRELLGALIDDPWCRDFIGLFDMEYMLDEKIILLSGGELRKFHIVKALLAEPDLLIIDNPYIGLDRESRQNLNALLHKIRLMKHRSQIVLVLSMVSEVSHFITHVIPVYQKEVCAKIAYVDFLRMMKPMESQAYEHLSGWLPALVLPETRKEIIRLNKVSIRYGNRTILKDLDWVVREGERWALSGKNGSGKSALLSLICADNPQSYACDITLFGRKRGTGESIWDIKKQIGYISPEMHRAYRKNIPAIEVVASGLYDTIGLYTRPSRGDLLTCEAWLNVFGIVRLKDRPYLQLSSGEQRLVLLARTLVKDPALLVLDEPFHGLDWDNRERVSVVINNFCKRDGKTFIMVTHIDGEWPVMLTDCLHLRTPEEEWHPVGCYSPVF